MKRFLLLLVTLLFSAFALAAVNINTATKEELDALPEIGPVKAQAIVDYRNANGPFKTLEDIMKVNGIKEGTFAKIKGTIDDLKLPPKGSEKEIVHLTLKSGADSMDVYLCPKSFMDDMGMDFAKGDEISLTGSKVKVGDADLVLAREIVKGNNSFIMRDAKGAPVW